MGLKNQKALYKNPVWILFARKIAFNKGKELGESYLGYEVAADRRRNKWLKFNIVDNPLCQPREDRQRLTADGNMN